MKIKILSALVLLFVCIQFIRPEPNNSDDNSSAIWAQYSSSEAVKNKLKSACLDCHSNITEYPWYSQIQPIAFWLNGHITEGKKHLNFSEFTNKKLSRQYHKLEETIEMINEGEMPLKSYTYMGLHPGANLSSEDKKLLINWAQSIMDTMKSRYPADSLIRKKKS